MARDILKAGDAIDRAKGINAGLGALVSLMLGCKENDIPDGHSMAELIWALQREMDNELAAAERHLNQ